MKTANFFKATLLAVLFTLAITGTQAQTNVGLVFKNPERIAGSNLKLNSVYLFREVYPGVDARLSIDSLINGAEVVKIDDNSGGLGYLNALQPEIKTPGRFLGEAYAVFTVSFYETNTTTPYTLDNVQGTALDLDGNALVKEFCEINMGGGVASYMSTTLDISVAQLVGSKFKAINILGIERDGIDTSAKGNMYTVTKQAVSSFKFRFGSATLASSGSASRQFSLYMKGFNYPAQITLPVEMISFTAALINQKAELKWITAAEKNVSHFVVEKSTNGTEYAEAGLVFAFGNSTQDRSYAFSDKDINTSKPGVTYYRLRSVDIDGKSQLSEIKVIRIGKANEQNIGLITYPNPVTSQVKITIPTAWQQHKVSYEVFSNAGQRMISMEKSSAGQTEIMDLSKLSTGFYIVSVKCNGETAIQKIVKN